MPEISIWKNTTQFIKKQPSLNECYCCKRTFKRLDHLAKHHSKSKEQENSGEEEAAQVNSVAEDYQDLTDFSMAFSSQVCLKSS